jgi:hypothetical protein
MNNPIKSIIDNVRNLGMKNHLSQVLNYGEQDEIDLIAYSGLEEQSGHLVIDIRLLQHPVGLII